MAAGWNIEGDFQSVVDTLESVTLLRQGCHDDADTLSGWRFREVVNVTESRGSGVRRIDVTWQLPVGDLLDPPIPGDVVVDEAGVGSTIGAVIRLRGSSRYTCSARRTELNSATAERFDVDRPVYVTTSEGLAIDRWERVRVAAEGHFAHVLADTSARHLLTILCEIPIEAGDRVHRHRGGVYRVESLSERADAGDPAVITIIDEAAYDALAS